MEKILLFTNDTEKEEKIRALCKRLGHETVCIQRSDIGCTVASVAAGQPKSSGKGRVPVLYAQPEIMIFSALPEQALDMFLSEYMRENIEKIELKAVVTPFNCGWSIYELTQELIKENRNMER